MVTSDSSVEGKRKVTSIKGNLCGHPRLFDITHNLQPWPLHHSWDPVRGYDSPWGEEGSTLLQLVLVIH